MGRLCHLRLTVCIENLGSVARLMEDGNDRFRDSEFILAIAVIAVWAFTGPMFRYSDTWQLVINTGTTIVTFLMVFLIQNTQNRDARAIHLKLNELIQAVDKAKNQMIDVESLSDVEIDELTKAYGTLRIKAQDREKREGVSTR
jgi:low affinity Fe/Cu permease